MVDNAFNSSKIKEGQKPIQISNLIEKTPSILTKLVLNALPNLLRSLISEELKNGSSFGKIGKIFGINKCVVFKIYKEGYFPKSPEKIQQLLDIYLDSI